MKEFHVSRKLRKILDLKDPFFFQVGRLIFADLNAAKKFAHIYNVKKEERISAGKVFAAGIITEILHYVCFLYQRDVKERAFEELLFHLYEKIGFANMEKVLFTFVNEFPPYSVYSGIVSCDEYLKEDRLQKRTVLIEELLLLWLENINGAFSFLKDAIDDECLKRQTPYLQVIKEIRNFFEKEKPFGPENQNLVDMLRSPAIYEPHSLEGQLKYILDKWGYLLSGIILKIKWGFDTLREEKVFFQPYAPMHEVYIFEKREEVPELFLEPDWMKNLVLIAKHTYVWLWQLSKKYGKDIKRIDQIPEMELKKLAEWGINGLWLVGLWERSPASKKIKNLCGMKDAISSAYSIYDYEIAKDLGGEEAYKRLKEKADTYGIKIACDMVPNHMGIDSKWVAERPEWFIYRLDNPYPWYSFTSENLSSDERMEIYIEDHYYDKTDAAVVFKRVDKVTGEVFYIYHGNDGTGMPWNDTAQLNYLLPEVRETMRNTILDIAKKFPIIRFDAAMTLTKMHYQRLWFPEPTKGGAIPTRSEFKMTKEEFDRHMPNEFWREVVDLVRKQSPETLLLAEAFWLLEGYFIKELGMHRVYNSAFMHMLRDEENAKYRQIIKNALEFNPEILGRFVNFMTNPDEKTAYEQFGDKEKYFGVLTLMVTMPGLPMFGHGQIEGLKERYGMEFKKPYLEEEVDEELLRRHEMQIFPLLRKRSLFSGTENFFLYDFVMEDGRIDEDVFAFSNRLAEEKTLVVYHNKNKVTEGWLKYSVPKIRKNGSGGRQTERKDLCEALSLETQEGYYTVFKDKRDGSEYVFENTELKKKGLYLKLSPYKTLVFTEIRELREDTSGLLKIIAFRKKGEPQKSVNATLHLLQSFLEFADFQRELKDFSDIGDKKELESLILRRAEIFLNAFSRFLKMEGVDIDEKEFIFRYRKVLKKAFELENTPKEKILKIYSSLTKNRESVQFLYFLILFQSAIFFLSLLQKSKSTLALILDVMGLKLREYGFFACDLYSQFELKQLMKN